MTTLRAFPGLISRMTVVLALVCVGVAFAAMSMTIQAPEGVTTVNFGSVRVQIEASAPVVVNLQSTDGVITGVVEPAAGSRSADVTVTLLGSPNIIIFDGKVTGPSRIEHFFVTQETGRGEG